MSSVAQEEEKPQEVPQEQKEEQQQDQQQTAGEDANDDEVRQFRPESSDANRRVCFHAGCRR